MATDMNRPWSAELPELPDARAALAVLAQLLDVLTYRNVNRDDVRDAYAAAIAAAADPLAPRDLRDQRQRDDETIRRLQGRLERDADQAADGAEPVDHSHDPEDQADLERARVDLGGRRGGFWRPTGGRHDDATSPNPWDWPDGPERRLALGHQQEADAPGYCTCGQLTTACPVDPRPWVNPYR